MILLDTSVLSAVLRRRQPGPTDARVAQVLSDLLGSGKHIGLPGLVLQELLSGIREESQFEKIKTILLRGYPIVLAEIRDHLLAADIVNRCRRKGIAVSSGDAVLAALTLNRNAKLFTIDQDFAHVARVLPLRLLEL